MGKEWYCGAVERMCERASETLESCALVGVGAGSCLPLVAPPLQLVHRAPCLGLDGCPQRRRSRCDLLRKRCVQAARRRAGEEEKAGVTGRAMKKRGGEVGDARATRDAISSSRYDPAWELLRSLTPAIDRGGWRERARESVREKGQGNVAPSAVRTTVCVVCVCATVMRVLPRACPSE